MDEILIVVPSKGRPEMMQSFIESWQLTTSGKSDILVGLDDDDETKTKYPISVNRALMVNGYELNKKNNILATYGASKGYPIIGCLSDDFIFHTKGWEDQIIEWQEVNKGICYGNDLLQGANLPTAPFIHSSIITALGYAAPPELIHYYIDNYWLELGMRLDKLKYFPDIIIEHKHWSSGKSIKDETYSNSEKLMTQDRETWDKYRETKLSEDVKKIKSL
jgi:hypothetical protein